MGDNNVESMLSKACKNTNSKDTAIMILVIIIVLLIMIAVSHMGTMAKDKKKHAAQYHTAPDVDAQVDKMMDDAGLTE